MSTHANCSHPATRSARATCRRQRARADSSTARKDQAEAAAKAPSKTVKASNGQRVSEAQIKALAEIKRVTYGGGAPNCKSLPTCRTIQAKGLAYFNTQHRVWMLTPAGEELVK